MTGFECFRIQGALDSRAAGLEEAERLLVEEHLADCRSCRDDAELRDGLRKLMLHQPPVLSRAARARLVSASVDRALADGPKIASEPRRHHVGFLLFAAAAATLAVWLAFDGPTVGGDHMVQGDDVSSPAWVDSAPVDGQRAVGSAHVLEGQALQGGGSRGEGATLAEGETLSTPNAARLVFGHATVQTTANTKLVWIADGSRLRLLSGRVDVDVDATVGRGFRVEAPDFRVEVLGTRFVVNTDSVEVLRGKVAVRRQGRELTKLVAGQRWQSGESPSVDNGVGDGAVSAPRSSPSVRQPGSTNSLEGAALLTMARGRLAAGRVDVAENLVRRALAGALYPSDRAEAQTLLAECALVRGDKDGAVRRYEVVAKSHAGTRAGENASFAAARARHTSGDWAAARALFSRYLTQYPHGRFRADAHRHIREIADREAP